MAIRENFTEAEWTNVLSSFGLGATLIVASDIGGQTGELMNGLKSVAEARTRFAASPLTAEIFTADKADLDKVLADRPRYDSMEAAVADASVRLKHTLDLLKQKHSEGKITDADYASYKDLVYFLAEKAAEGGKEGAFMGIFGGVQVSDKEKAALASLKTMLDAA